ncbi:MAG: transporter substrate-binding domain-containing protein, partial [Magnetococcales bacterium]|nr:transporter substrate-binding domain-containing protein [Magnetococcales bacterium]
MKILKRTRLPAIVALAPLCVFLLTLLVSSPLQAETDDSPTLSVAYCQDCLPFQFTNADGAADGLIIDYWRLWSKKTAISVEFIAAPWKETLSLVREGTVDAHAGLFFNDERDAFLDYGVALSKTDTHLFFHRSIPVTRDFQQLTAYRVGVLSKDYVESFLKEKTADGHIVGYPDYDTLVSALKRGELRVFAADTPSGLYHLKRAGLLADFNRIGDAPLYRNEWFVATREGNSSALKVVNEGMASITSTERRTIGRRWTASGDRGGKSALIIGMERDRPPYAFLNAQGRPAGLFVDLWRAWSKKSGREIRFHAAGRNEILEKLRNGEVDMHAGLPYLESQAAWIGYSDQIYRTGSRLYYRQGAKPPPDPLPTASYSLGIQTGSFQEKRVQTLF